MVKEFEDSKMHKFLIRYAFITRLPTMPKDLWHLISFTRLDVLVLNRCNRVIKGRVVIMKGKESLRS